MWCCAARQLVGRSPRPGLRRIFRTHRESSGAVRVRPHRLRHTYGTELAAAGIDLLVLRDLMGHVNPETTAAYVHLAPTPSRPSTRAVAQLPIGADAKRQRRNAAQHLLVVHPSLIEWLSRPTPARLVDLKRTGAWSFLTWCFVEGHLRPDLDLLLARLPGDLYAEWICRHADDVARIVEVAERFGWSGNWTRDVSRGGLSLLCLTAGKGLDELTDDDSRRSPASSPMRPAPARTPGSTTLPACSACTRSATSCGSASGHQGGPGRAGPPSSSACRPFPNRTSARLRCAT